MEIIDRIPLELDVEQILDILHIDRNGRYAEDVGEMIDMVRPVIRPKAIYDVCYVEHEDRASVRIGGVRFTSRVLRVNLDKVGRVFPFIATSGTEAESIEVPSDDLMKRFILDTIKETALDFVTKYLYEHIQKKYRIGQLSSMTPGSLEDWPLSEQRQLFSIFGDVEKILGVKLTDSFLMIPIKSVSGIYFPTEVSFESCQLCPRERCPSRRAKYDEKLREKYFAE